MSNENCPDNSVGGFVAGAAVTGGIALIHNAVKNDRHQQEIANLTSLISNQSTIIKQQDAKIAKLNADLATEKAERTTERCKAAAEIGHLKQLNADLMSTVKT